MRCLQLSVLVSCAVSCAVWTVSHRAMAADITFSPAKALSGDPLIDFGVTGEIDRAHAIGNQGRVDFVIIKFAPMIDPSDSHTLAGSGIFPTPGLSGPYAELLSHGLSTNGAPASFTLGALTPGVAYDVAFVARSKSDCCQAGASYNNLFVSGPTSTGGQLIQWDDSNNGARIIHGQFVADVSGQQTILFNAFGVSGFDPASVTANINAMILSHAVPEPSTVLLALLAVCGLPRFRATGRLRSRGDR